MEPTSKAFERAVGGIEKANLLYTRIYNEREGINNLPSRFRKPESETERIARCQRVITTSAD